MTYGTYQRMRCHVSDSDITVIRKAQGRIAKHHRATGKRHTEAREGRKAFYRAMLEYHHNAQQLCREWRM